MSPDAREFYDPESGSSSGATHVPSQLSTILSPRTMPRRDSWLPHDTRNIMDTSGNVFERPSAQEGLSSTIFDNSKNLASPSQKLRWYYQWTKTKWWNEKRFVQYTDSSTSLPKQEWNAIPHNGTLFRFKNSCCGIESLEISWPHRISKLED